MDLTENYWIDPNQPIKIYLPPYLSNNEGNSNSEPLFRYFLFFNLKPII